MDLRTCSGSFRIDRAKAFLTVVASLPERGTIIRKRELGISRKDRLFSITSSLEECYDDHFPLEIKVNKLLHSVTRLPTLQNIDCELLGWIASARWLHRNGQNNLANYCLSEYRAKCLRLSNGASYDVLNIASDLFSDYATWSDVDQIRKIHETQSAQ